MSSSFTAQSNDLTSHVGAEFFCRKIRALDSITIRPGARVLVAGCGAGHEAALIQKRMNADVTGVDVENFLKPKFNEWPNFKFQVTSVTDLPYEDNCFDAVFYHHVIEHVDDPARSLRELSRVLKPSGWIFVGTPNRHRLVSSLGAHKQVKRQRQRLESPHSREVSKQVWRPCRFFTTRALGIALKRIRQATMGNQIVLAAKIRRPPVCLGCLAVCQ